MLAIQTEQVMASGLSNMFLNVSTAARGAYNAAAVALSERASAAASGAVRVWSATKAGMSSVWEFMHEPKPVSVPYLAVNPSLECAQCLDPLYKTDENGRLVITNESLTLLDDPQKRNIVRHGRCPPVHLTCITQWVAQHGYCINCRQPTHVEGQQPPAASIPALIAPMSFRDSAILWSRWGISTLAGGAYSIGRRISGEMFYSLFWSAVLAGGAVALNAVVDANPAKLLVGGPVLGGLAGSAFGAALAGSIGHMVFGVSAYLMAKKAQPFNRFVRVAISLALSGVAAVLAWKIGVLVGGILTAEWIKICVAPCDVSTIFKHLWKITMTKGLSIGLSEVCVVTLAQIELFGIAAAAWGAFTLARRVLFEELPRQWNGAQQDPLAPAQRRASVVA
jgi:hypothetical protein